MLLSVTVQTDLVPGVEFHAVEVTLDGAERVSVAPAFVGHDFRTGRTVATFDGLTEGTHRVDVALLDSTGTASATQPVLVTLSGTGRSITVLLVRACVGVECGDGEVCASGVCAPEVCRDDPLDPSCPPPGCERDDECTSRASCAEPLCIENTCLSFGRDDACAEQDLCHPELGCVPRPVSNTLPVARFIVAPEVLPCDETEIILDASSSQPGASAAPLARYRWTVRGPDGEIVLALDDVGDAVIDVGARTVGGSHRQPRINLTDYEGQHAARVRVSGTGGVNQIFFAGLRLEPEDRYVVRFAGRSAGGANLDLGLIQHDVPYTPYGLVEPGVDLLEAWSTWEQEFVTTGFSAPVNDGRLWFRFRAAAEFWIDRVQLIRVVDGNRLIDTRFETGAEGWRDNFEDGGFFDQPVITPGTGDEGAYELELVVVDEDGVESPPARQSIVHALCAPE